MEQGASARGTDVGHSVLEAVWKRARSDLLIPTPKGDPDVFLWEHSSRVAQTAQHIAQLPVVRAKRPNEAAVVAAALYHDAGWLNCIRNGSVERIEVLSGPLSEADHEEGAALMERSLSTILARETLETAVRALRCIRNRASDLIEAQIVAEAENLQEFGVVSLWSAIRRGAVDGKGVQAVLDGWRRKKEYQFWAARLHDSFRFEPVRELARQRLEKLERVLQELDEQHSSADVEALLKTRVDETSRFPVPRPQ